MKSKFTAALALIASLFASPVNAGIEDTIALRQLAAHVSETIDAYRDRGWHVHDFEPAWINNGSFREFTIRLNAGDSMIFRGMGDSDARDIDLAVFGPNGRLVGKDLDYDASPVVTFRAPRTGTYTIRLGVQACTANGSYVALLAAER